MSADAVGSDQGERAETEAQGARRRIGNIDDTSEPSPLSGAAAGEDDPSSRSVTPIGGALMRNRSRHDTASTSTPPRTGPMITGMFSTLLGMHLPGNGTNYLKQTVRFVTPALVGEPLTADVEITRTVPGKHLVYLATTCRGDDGRTIADGRALVLARGLPAPGFLRRSGVTGQQ